MDTKDFDPILTVDLFSGIGGMQLALQGVTQTVLYCDIDKYCTSVISERIEDGRLHPAPIHSDIKNLHLSPYTNAVMICGGFPCVDLSSIGLQNGIKEGTHSGLFLQVMRLVDECPSIKVLFLENVSNIIRVGMKEVIDELSKRNFTMSWTMKSAGSLGAPHLRNRWFCLATRDNFNVDILHNKLVNAQALNDSFSFVTDWSDEPARRFSFKPNYRPDPSFDPNWIMRSGTLGNTVCPYAVRCAFEELVKLHKNIPHITNIFSDYSKPIDTLNYPYPQTGVIYNNNFFVIPSTASADNMTYPKITITHQQKLLSFGKFPTPRHGVTHASSITDRSLKDLPTLLVHCEESREIFKSENVDKNLFNKLHTIVVPNVNYIEWMMGFPKDWTKSNAPKSVFKNNNSVRINTINDSSSSTSKVSTKHNTLNGMHVFMRLDTNKGKTIKEFGKIWSELSPEEKLKYKLFAQEERIKSSLQENEPEHAS
jgi:DNA (cytosine-5)-methyltransferase 1